MTEESIILVETLILVAINIVLVKFSEIGSPI